MRESSQLSIQSRASKTLSRALRKFDMAITYFVKSLKKAVTTTEADMMLLQLQSIGLAKWQCHILAKCCSRFKTNDQFRITIVNGASAGYFDIHRLNHLIENTPPELMGDPSPLITKIAFSDTLMFGDVFNHLALPFRGFTICAACGSEGWIQIQKENSHSVKCDCGSVSGYMYRKPVKSQSIQ